MSQKNIVILKKLFGHRFPVTDPCTQEVRLAYSYPGEYVYSADKQPKIFAELAAAGLVDLVPIHRGRMIAARQLRD